MDIQVLWAETQEEGRQAYYNGLNYNQNPYPESDDYQSPYAAWKAGWLEVDNANIEFNSGGGSCL